MKKYPATKEGIEQFLDDLVTREIAILIEGEGSYRAIISFLDKMDIKWASGSNIDDPSRNYQLWIPIVGRRFLLFIYAGEKGFRALVGGLERSEDYFGVEEFMAKFEDIDYKPVRSEYDGLIEKFLL